LPSVLKIAWEEEGLLNQSRGMKRNERGLKVSDEGGIVVSVSENEGLLIV
jgi:hypothetical protein